MLQDITTLRKLQIEIYVELRETYEKQKAMFNGVLYDKEIYDTFSLEEKRIFANRMNLRYNLQGQLDMISILFGDEPINKQYFLNKIENSSIGGL